MDATKKTCRMCGVARPLDAFHRLSRAADGRQSACKECRSTYGKANRDKTLATERVWRAANKERIDEKARAWRAANPGWWNGSSAEARKEKQRAYMEANPHLGWESRYRHRARAAGFEPVIERFTRDDLIGRYGAECVYCGGEFQELDHYIAVANGGHHTLDNARPSCTSCNSSKQDLDEAWRPVRGLVEDVTARFNSGETVIDIAAATGRRPSTISKALRRSGRVDMSRIFSAHAERERRSAIARSKESS